MLNPLVTYIRNQRLRPIEITADKQMGFDLFNSIGCAACHTPRPYKGDKKRTVVYSDLLVHDMGKNLASTLPANSGLGGDVSGREWRTPPLWGINRSVASRLKPAYLHDGRAETIEQAILWHGGEAYKAKSKFANLPVEHRKILLDFIKGL